MVEDFLVLGPVIVLDDKGPLDHQPAEGFPVGGQAVVGVVHRSFGPPAARPFRSAVVDWSYPVDDETDEATFGSALVTPLTGTGVQGTLVAYARARNAFSPEDA